MGERERLAEEYLQWKVSRRSVLKASLAAPLLGGAFLEACGNAGTTTTTTNSPTRFPGVTLTVYSGVTSGQVADAAAKVWEQKTGGKVVVNKIPFADRAVKYAGVIASQDPSVDVIYAYSGYVGQFGDRLYDDLTHLAGDTSDFVPATLKVLSSKGKLLALPIHSEMEIYIYNKAMFRDAGMDPENPPTTWEELYKSASKLNVGSRYGCVVPWIESTLTFYGVFLNSTPTRLLTDDRNQIAFNNADGLSAFTAINEGFQAKFFDPAAFFLT